jgi:hypothetical protein
LLRRLRVPTVTRPLRSYAALRLPAHLRSQLRFPSLSTYLFGGCFFLAGTREHPLSRSRRRFLSTGSPSCRCSPEEWPGPPRFLGRPFRARHGRTPRQVCHPLAPLLVMALLPSGILAPWAPGIHSFRGRLPVAHTLAGLRIAITVTRNGARPCFRPAGLGFGRVGFSPTGRHTEFQSVSPPPSFRTSLAWSLPIYHSARFLEDSLFARIISSEYLNALVDFFESRCLVILRKARKLSISPRHFAATQR